MNGLYISAIKFEMSQEKTDKLVASGAIYWCDSHGGYHLTPDHTFHLGEIEILMVEE